MARILPYSSEVSPDAALSPRNALASDAGNSGMADLGAGLQKSGDIIYTAAEQQETTDTYSALANKRSYWTAELARRVNTPSAANDPNFSENFARDMGNDLADLGNDLATKGARLALQRGTSELAQELTTKAGIEQVKTSGIRAVASYSGTLNDYRNTLINDPSQFQSVLRDAGAALNDPSGPYSKMPPEARATFELDTKEKLALSAVEGRIRQDPYAAMDELQNGDWSKYIQADKMNTMMYRAQVTQMGWEREATRQDALADKAQRQAREDEENNVIKDIFSDNPKMTAPDIANNPTLSPPQKLTMIEVQARSVKPDPLAAISHDTTMKLMPLISLPYGDPNKIIGSDRFNQEFAAGHLTRGDFDWLRTTEQQSRTAEGDSLVKRQNDFIKSVEPQLDKSTMFNIDGEGKSRAYNFNYVVNQMVQSYKQAGKNPYDLFDPSKPDYLGKAEVVSSFQAPLDQQIKNITRMMSPSTPVVPRLPGESIEAWRSRTGTK